MNFNEFRQNLDEFGQNLQTIKTEFRQNLDETKLM
jgi:hypothetical protein